MRIEWGIFAQFAQDVKRLVIREKRKFERVVEALEDLSSGAAHGEGMLDSILNLLILFLYNFYQRFNCTYNFNNVFCSYNYIMGKRFF